MAVLTEVLADSLEAVLERDNFVVGAAAVVVVVVVVGSAVVEVGPTDVG